MTFVTIGDWSEDKCFAFQCILGGDPQNLGYKDVPDLGEERRRSRRRTIEMAYLIIEIKSRGSVSKWEI